MRSFSAASVVALTLLWTSPASADQLTLEQLLAGGTLEINGFVFSDFHNFTQNGDITVDPADILVSTITDVVNGETEWGIRFQTDQWDLDTPSQNYDLGLDFSVTRAGGIIDNTLSLVGHGEGDFDAHVVEGVTDPSNLQTLANKLVFTTPSGDQLVDHDDFPYEASLIEVHKDFAMHTGDLAGSQINVSHFDQTFSVPEPATLSLLGLYVPFAIRRIARRRQGRNP